MKCVRCNEELPSGLSSCPYCDAGAGEPFTSAGIRGEQGMLPRLASYDRLHEAVPAELSVLDLVWEAGGRVIQQPLAFCLPIWLIYALSFALVWLGNQALTLSGTLASSVVMAPLTGGLMMVLLQGAAGAPVGARHMMAGLERWKPLMLWGVVGALLSGAPEVVPLLGGGRALSMLVRLIFLMVYMPLWFTPWLIVGRDEQLVEAMKQSVRFTIKLLGVLFRFLFVFLALVVVLGVLFGLFSFAAFKSVDATSMKTLLQTVMTVLIGLAGMVFFPVMMMTQAALYQKVFNNPEAMKPPATP